MNHQQTATVIAYLNRAGLVGAMEGQVTVWAEALTDLDLTEVQAAAREMARTRRSTERWVTPGDVRAKVNELRLWQRDPKGIDQWLINS